MTDERLDSDQTGTMPGSAPDAKQSSFDPAILQSTLETLTKRIEEIDARSRSLQGDKDRGIVKTSKEVDELKRKFAEVEKLTKNGLSLDEAVEEHSFRESVQQLKNEIGRINPAPAQSTGSVDGEAGEVVKVFEKFGLDFKDPRVLVELRKPFANGDQIELAARRLKDALSTQPSPIPSQAPAHPGTAPQKVDVSDKITRLATLQKEPTKYKAEIKKLVAELDAVGWGG